MAEGKVENLIRAAQQSRWLDPETDLASGDCLELGPPLSSYNYQTNLIGRVMETGLR